MIMLNTFLDAFNNFFSPDVWNNLQKINLLVTLIVSLVVLQLRSKLLFIAALEHIPKIEGYFFRDLASNKIKLVLKNNGKYPINNLYISNKSYFAFRKKLLKGMSRRQLDVGSIDAMEKKAYYIENNVLVKNVAQSITHDAKHYYPFKVVYTIEGLIKKEIITIVNSERWGIE